MTGAERVATVLLGLLLLGLAHAIAVTIANYLLDTIREATP